MWQHGGSQEALRGSALGLCWPKFNSRHGLEELARITAAAVGGFWLSLRSPRLRSRATFDPDPELAFEPRRSGDPEIKPHLCWEAVDMTWEGSFMGVLGKNGVVKAGVLRVPTSGYLMEALWGM